MKIVQQLHVADAPHRLGYPKFCLQQGAHVVSIQPLGSCTGILPWDYHAY